MLGERTEYCCSTSVPWTGLHHRRSNRSVSYALEINWIIIAPVWEHHHQHLVATGLATSSSSTTQNANDCASRSSPAYATSTVLNLSGTPPRANSVTSPTTLSVGSENPPSTPRIDSHAFPSLRGRVRHFRTRLTIEAGMNGAKLPSLRKLDRSIHPMNETCYGQLNPAYTFTP